MHSLAGVIVVTLLLLARGDVTADEPVAESAFTLVARDRLARGAAEEDLLAELLRADLARAVAPGTVTAVEEKGVRLDRTIFYPTGGGTGLIGDPSGKTAERAMQGVGCRDRSGDWYVTDQN